MKIEHNTLGFIIMKIFEKHSSCGSPVSYMDLMSLIPQYSNLNPSYNTVVRTVRALNEFAHANIQGIGTKTGLWVADGVEEEDVKALFAQIVTAEYLPASCIKRLQGILSILRRRGPFQKAASHSGRERQENFLKNLGFIIKAQDDKKQLCFIYNDLDIQGKYKPRLDKWHPDGVREISVYGYFSKNSYFYMVGREKNSPLMNYRIDRMTNLSLTGVTAEPLYDVPGYENQKILPMDEYLKDNYKMFNRDIIQCTFELITTNTKKIDYYISTIWDELGEHELSWSKKSDHLRFSARLPTLGALLFVKQFGVFVKLIAPADLRQELQEYYASCLQDYTDNANKKGKE